MAYQSEGPRVGLQVSASPVDSTVRARTHDAEIETFVRGLGQLNSALQDNFMFERKQDLEAGQQQGRIGGEQQPGSTRSFAEGFMKGSGEAAAIRDSGDLRAKVATEAPNDPVKAQAIIAGFHKGKTEGITQPHFAEGYNRIMANEASKLVASSGEESAKEVISQNDINASDRIGYVVRQGGNDHKLTWQAINDIAAEHHLTGTRKDQLVLTVMEQVAQEGKPGALALLDSMRIDAKTGKDFPALSSNPAFTAKVQSLKNVAESKWIQNMRQEADTTMMPFLEQATEGKLNEGEFKKWAAQYDRVLSSQTIMGVIHANRSALARQQMQVDKIAAIEANRTAKGLVDSNATAAFAAGGSHLLAPQTIPSASGTSNDTISVEAQQEAGRDGWLAANPNATPQQMALQGALNITKSGRSADMPPLTNPIRKLLSAGIAEYDYKPDPKTGEIQKPIPGELSPESMKALALYRQIPQAHQGWLKEQLGQKSYELLQFIDDGMAVGLSPTEAAGLAHRINVKGKTYEDKKEFAKALREVTQESVSSSIMRWIGGGDFKADGNVESVRDRIHSTATLYMMSGLYANAEDAAKAATKDLSKQMFVASNATYFSADFPVTPKTFTDKATGVKVLLAESVQYASDKSIGADDLTLDRMGNGNWMVKYKKDREIVRSADGKPVTWSNDQIAAMWAQKSQAEVDAFIAGKDKEAAQVQALKDRPKSSGATRRGNLAAQAAERSATNQ
jgi:hypothetical protein